MRHIFRFIWCSIKNHVNAFWKSFAAGAGAYVTILLGISPPPILEWFGVAWVLFKACAIGAFTAMGTTMWQEFWTNYKSRKTRKENGKQSGKSEKKEKAA